MVPHAVPYVNTRVGGLRLRELWRQGRRREAGGAQPGGRRAPDFV